MMEDLSLLDPDDGKSLNFFFFIKSHFLFLFEYLLKKYIYIHVYRYLFHFQQIAN